jgi:hypothetical protein
MPIRTVNEYSGISFAKPLRNPAINLQSSKDQETGIAKTAHYQPSGRSSPKCTGRGDDLLDHPGACACFSRLQVRVKSMEEKNKELNAKLKSLTEEAKSKDEQISKLEGKVGAEKSNENHTEADSPEKQKNVTEDKPADLVESKGDCISLILTHKSSSKQERRTSSEDR